MIEDLKPNALIFSTGKCCARMSERRLVYNWVAREAEKGQAEREAREQHEIDIEDPRVDQRSEEEQIQNKYVGLLGEIVACNRNGWKRARTPDKISLPYDAIDDHGLKVEIKTRTKWKREILVSRDCDYALLLFYWNDNGAEHFEPIRRFERSKLRPLPDYHGELGMFLRSHFWQKLLRDARVPERFVA